MSNQLQKTNYECFCEFAWLQLSKVFDIDELPLASLSPIVEFVEGCAFTALFDHSPDDQLKIFGFTLDQVHADEFSWEFYCQLRR